MSNVKFLLEEDGKPVNVFDTLQGAKEEGAKLTGRSTSLLITSMAVAIPAPSMGWRYDKEVADWVRTDLP